MSTETDIDQFSEFESALTQLVANLGHEEHILLLTEFYSDSIANKTES